MADKAGSRCYWRPSGLGCYNQAVQGVRGDLLVREGRYLGTLGGALDGHGADRALCVQIDDRVLIDARPAADAPCAKRPKISSTEVRHSRMIRFPPKMSGLTVMRWNKGPSCIFCPRSPATSLG